MSFFNVTNSSVSVAKKDFEAPARLPSELEEPD